MLTDANFRTRGYYDPRRNATTDENFRTRGYGNLLASLLQVQTSQTAPTQTASRATQSSGCGGLALIAFIALAILDAPGIIYNYANDRFTHDPDGVILSSIRDKDAWYISLMFWGVLAAIIFSLYWKHREARLARERALSRPLALPRARERSTLTTALRHTSTRRRRLCRAVMRTSVCLISNPPLLQTKSARRIAISLKSGIQTTTAVMSGFASEPRKR